MEKTVLFGHLRSTRCLGMLNADKKVLILLPPLIRLPCSKCSQQRQRQCSSNLLSASGPNGRCKKHIPLERQWCGQSFYKIFSEPIGILFIVSRSITEEIQLVLQVTTVELRVMQTIWSLPDSSSGKESACNTGGSGLIPGSGRSLEKG